jgi:membrane complex biogenesis BtpA family protein
MGSQVSARGGASVSVFREIFHKDKVVIAMAHFPPLPGTPLYDEARGIAGIYEAVRNDVLALQGGGVDGIMFGNEGDRPYRTRVGPEIVSTMAAVIGQLKSELTVPFGVDVLWDPVAALSVAMATGARWIREIMTGVYASDMGLWNTDCGEALRFRRQIGADDVKVLFNIKAEFAHPLDGRRIEDIARSVVFSSLADAVAVSGPITGTPVDQSELERVKQAVPGVAVLANTGVRRETAAEILRVADGVVVGTSMKEDGVTWNPVDPERVRAFMAEVARIRGGALIQSA